MSEPMYDSVNQAEHLLSLMVNPVSLILIDALRIMFTYHAIRIVVIRIILVSVANCE